MNLLITGGGTGGHLVIAKAMKEEALNQNITPFYIGSTYGQDRAWFGDDASFKSKIFYSTSGVVNKKGLSKLRSLLAIFKATYKAAQFIKKERIDAVLSVGGYSAAPASFAAILCRKPLFIHEQNATIGRLNKLLRPFCTHFFSSYFEPKCDYPVRNDFFATKRVRSEVKTLIFLGGSQGATAINTLALTLAPWLQENHIAIIHQCGTAHLESIKKAYDALKIEATLFDFTTQMPDYLTQADFAIARAGASSVWELTANMLPTLFIPYPYASNDHQTANAQAHVDQHVAWLMQENDLDLALLKAILKQNMQEVSCKLEGLLKKEGAFELINTIKKESKC